MTNPPILLSLHPTWAALVLNGQKTIEVRRRFLPAHALRTLAVVYETSPRQAVVGVVTLTHQSTLSRAELYAQAAATHIPNALLDAYLRDQPYGVAITLAHPTGLTHPITRAQLHALGHHPPQHYAYASPALMEAVRKRQS